MSDRQEIEQAIIVLEAQRTALGDDVVDISLDTLRQKLESLQTQPFAEQYEQLVVLVADLSDYTALSESMDPEDLRDTVNALWQKLDKVINAWGGSIDKHTGDGLIALFGAPTARRDDRERAILAALDMQMELALFNTGTANTPTENKPYQADLKMRIGIDNGPVFFGKMGMSGEYSARGEAVSRAIRLQRAAPVDGILISYDLYSKVHLVFEAKATELLDASGEKNPVEAYRLIGEKPQGYQELLRSLGMRETRFVGRQAELEQLQAAVQRTMDGNRASFLTVVGEAGSGKSRLLYEFEQLLKLLPMRVTQFNASAQRDASRFPFALVRDLFLKAFGIHAMSSPAVVREKLRQGFARMTRDVAGRSDEYVNHIGRLLGLNFSSIDSLPDVANIDALVREQAIEKVVDFFRAVILNSPVTLFILEDVHWADERTLDLLDYLYERCHDLPLLIVCTARPSLFEFRPSWKATEPAKVGFHQQLWLAPLSAIDSRHMVAEVIQDPVPLPIKLTDLIVERTGGNPAYIQDMTRMLIESDVVVKEANQWRVQMGLLQDKQMLPTLTNMLQIRLEQLSEWERETLQRAAVFGRTFWKSAVIHLSGHPDDAGVTNQIETALWSLEQQELIDHHSASAFPGLQEFVFRHNSLRRLAYESIPAEELRHYHARAAAWLIIHGEGGDSPAASIVAGHFERAGDTEQAAAWYGRAATHAQETHAPDTAIQQYQYALQLLPDSPETADRRVSFNEGLGQMLRRRARFVEAAAAYQEMLKAARSLHDASAETRALLGIFINQNFQGDYSAASESSRQAEEAARRSGSVALLATALAAKGWALARLDDVDQALDLAKESQTISTAAGDMQAIAFSNALIGYLCQLQRWFDQAVRATEKARDLFRELGDRLWEASMLGNLGHIAYIRVDYQEAGHYFRESLRIARDIGDYYGTMRCLRMLGRIAERQGDFTGAANRANEAFLFAQRSGNVEYCARIAADLGRLHLDRAVPSYEIVNDLDRDIHMGQARSWLESALQLGLEARMNAIVASAQLGMAQLLIGEELPDEALPLAIDALKNARKMIQEDASRKGQETLGLAWRVLGQVAGDLLPQELPVNLDGEAYDAPACFNESIRCLAQMGRGYEGELGRTLHRWALYELGAGNRKRGLSLLRRSKDIFTQFGMTKEAEWLSQSHV